MSLAAAFARPVYGGVGCIVCLHRVLPEAERSSLPDLRALEITPEDLRGVLEWSRARRFDVIALDDVPDRLDKPRGRKFVAFTFDDGYKDNLVHALPIFREFGMPFAVNITSGLVDGREPAWWYAVAQALNSAGKLAFAHQGRQFSFQWREVTERNRALEEISGLIRKLGLGERNAFVRSICEPGGVDPIALTRGLLMTWDEVRTLAKDPLATIGAHTQGHYDLKLLSDREARAELLNGKQTLEAQLGREVRHLAYPFGGRSAVGEREFRLAAECGFDTAVTTRTGNLFPAHAATLQALPRIGISGNYSAVNAFRRVESGLVTAVEQRFRRIVITE